MANAIDRQILLDGYRNAVVKLTGVLDTSDVAIAPAVLLSDFINNDAGFGRLVGLRVDEVSFSVGPVLQVLLEWESTDAQQIVACVDTGSVCAEEFGGMVPDRTRIGYTGNVNLRTKNWVAAVQSFTVILEMVKLYA